MFFWVVNRRVCAVQHEKIESVVKTTFESDRWGFTWKNFGCEVCARKHVHALRFGSLEEYVLLLCLPAVVFVGTKRKHCETNHCEPVDGEVDSIKRLLS